MRCRTSVFDENLDDLFRNAPDDHIRAWELELGVDPRVIEPVLGGVQRSVHLVSVRGPRRVELATAKRALPLGANGQRSVLDGVGARLVEVAPALLKP